MPSKLEESWKSGLAQASTTGTHEQQHPSPTTGVGSTATTARGPVRQARHRRLAAVLRLLRYISWFVPIARSRLARGPSPAHTVRLSRLADASPLTQLPLTPCFYFLRRLAHVPRSSRCR